MGKDPKEIAEKYIKEFHEDMDILNVERADIEPKATEHIDEIIKLIEILLDKKNAYVIDGDVYYSVESFKEYGKLSGSRLEDMEAGVRVEIDKRKKNPFDFALWKSAKPGEPFWDSPWSKGRPGWHIECSAMSSKYLGSSFDIHGGGKDLIFPHHENEIAQSEGTFCKPFVRYWIHNGFVNINKEKMSKSLGNFLTIKELLAKCHPEAIRFFLLSNHYRSPIDFTDKNFEDAGAGLDKVYALMQRIEANTDEGKSGKYWELFCQAMDDDFNTAKGIGILFNAVRSINRLLDNNKEESQQDLQKIIASVKKDIQKIGNILGILTETPISYFEKKRAVALKKHTIDHDQIDKLVFERAEARKAKDWKRADEIREQLAEMNIIVEDKPEGTVWKVVN
eukprot:CAMPEP_0201283112 /NCGR_PEP_ID=MMETSP1317-20130820/7647_1 /ASSEMBLY_ACC=CAM_ASM_000770 /TAXON_ID=187299 /ORGANISM="Undescribed Undescribed, Strain Undescribed" /LENGTH=393 /DNA_ID=CAMNT_0047598217 /DNA_START=1158 /DNA_END=2339 /DNA_ORIENTATION=+